MPKNPSEVALKWKNRASAASSDYAAGVERVNESPTKKAAANEAKFKAKLLAAIESGKWKKGLESVSLEDWKEAVRKKGTVNYSTGVNAAESKMEEFMSEFLPHVYQGKAIVDKMPNITLEQNIARAVEMMKHNAKFKRSKYK